MTQPWVIADIAKRTKAADVIRQVLSTYGLTLPDFRNEIHVQQSFVREHSNRHEVSRAVLNQMFPAEPTPSTLYHYTDLKGLAGIATSGKLRLYPIRKRIDQGGELSAFAKAHRLDGYLNSTQGEPYFKELSDDLFYVSLTRVPPKDPSLMWGVFAGGTGVRLEFEVEPRASELRPVHYEPTGGTTLLIAINDALMQNDLPPFVPSTISQIGAFYLSSLVSSEDEVRLMQKRYKGGLDLTENDGQYDYLPIPINTENRLCKLTLKGIHVAPSGSVSAVATAISQTLFEKISPTGP